MGSSQSSPNANASVTFPKDQQQYQQDKKDGDSSENNNNNDDNPYRVPIDKASQELDKVAASLPAVIDSESQQQVDDYRQACDNGKGPMVACFATGEYLALLEQNHEQAAALYRNVCFRDKTDKSPNGVLVDGTKAYTPGCFNLAKMTMTGKGGVKIDNAEAYRIFDRACRGGHGGSCFIQAKILLQSPGILGPGVPHDPQKAMDLYERNCTEGIGDSVSCFTLATMLLRGERISMGANNASPQEARGLEPIQQRRHEKDRTRKAATNGEDDEEELSIPRNPRKAEWLLQKACDTGSHVTSCHNLAVMYAQGDEGVPADPEKAELYMKKTESMMGQFGGF